MTQSDSPIQTSHCKELMDELRGQLLNNFVYGQEDTLKYAFTAFLCGGHILLEGAPGTGKTVVAKLLSEMLSRSFKRIQFTSDLLPADILGASIYSPSEQDFQFIPGPIFSDFVLADEVNRTPPRTQSALLEAMEERKVTVEGKTYQLSDHFFVVATQNPREFEGTFPLPEAQLDRFLFKLQVPQLDPATELLMLQATLEGKLPPPPHSTTALTVDWSRVGREIESVKVDESILRYVADLLHQTRSHRLLEWGSSFRGGMALVRAARVIALFGGRGYVIPDDILELVPIALGHRIRLTPEAEMSGESTVGLLSEVSKELPFPS